MSEYFDEKKFLHYKAQCSVEKKDKTCEIPWEKYFDESNIKHEKCKDYWCSECNTLYHQACDDQFKNLNVTTTSKEDKIPYNELINILNIISKIEKESIENYDGALNLLKKIQKLESCKKYREVHHKSCIRKYENDEYKFGADSNHQHFIDNLNDVIDKSAKKYTKINSFKSKYINKLKYKPGNYNAYSDPKSFRASGKRKTLNKINQTRKNGKKYTRKRKIK